MVTYSEAAGDQRTENTKRRAPFSKVQCPHPLQTMALGMGDEGVALVLLPVGNRFLLLGRCPRLSERSSTRSCQQLPRHGVRNKFTCRFMLWCRPSLLGAGTR